MNIIYLTTFLYLLCRAYYMYMYICYYLLNSVFLKNKCYKIINQLVVETLKGNNITQEGIYSLYNFVRDNFKEYDLDTEYINYINICFM
jgi:hypothetical protein